MPAAPLPDTTRYTLQDVIDDDDLANPIDVQLHWERHDRHNDEAIAQRRIDAMCRENSKPNTSAVLSVLPADRKAA
jgi:hypothetical protein